MEELLLAPSLLAPYGSKKSHHGETHQGRSSGMDYGESQGALTRGAVSTIDELVNLVKPRSLNIFFLHPHASISSSSLVSSHQHNFRKPGEASLL